MSEALLEVGFPITARPPEAVIAWHDGRTVTVSEMLGDAEGLARRLPEHGVLINACASRYAFLVGFVACLMRGRACLLPGERSAQRLAALRATHPQARVLTDVGGLANGLAAAMPGVPALEVGVLTGARAHNPAGLAASDDASTIAFTSGSTGAPVPHARSWRSQARQLDAVARRFGLDGPATVAVVATVPHAHMYGFECTVLLPLRANVAVHSGIPLYPDDVRRALEAVPAPRMLVTSPVHLRALAGAAASLGDIRMVLSATAPLSSELATAVEASAHTEVYEIYGCTEAGSVASRRTVGDGRWTPFDGLAVTVRDAGAGEGAGGFQVTLPREPAAIALHDVLALEGDGRFQLIGRVEDMVKVGGKRASLAALNRALLDIAGVVDGAFVMPDHADPDAAGTIRPVTLVVAPTLTAKGVLEGLRRRIDPAFVPRRVVMPDALPRDAVGKLTKAQVATLLAASSGDEVTAAVAFPADHPALAGHFPGQPVFPGVVVLDAVAAQARASFGLGPLAEVIQAKFIGAVPPGATATVRLRRRVPTRVVFELRLDGALLSSGELAFREGEA